MSTRVVALPVGETTVLRLAPPGSGGGAAVTINVTPLDACHCLVRIMGMLHVDIEHSFTLPLQSPKAHPRLLGCDRVLIALAHCEIKCQPSGKFWPTCRER